MSAGQLEYIDDGLGNSAGVKSFFALGSQGPKCFCEIGIPKNLPCSWRSDKVLGFPVSFEDLSKIGRRIFKILF